MATRVAISGTILRGAAPSHLLQRSPVPCSRSGQADGYTGRCACVTQTGCAATYRSALGVRAGGPHALRGGVSSGDIRPSLSTAVTAAATPPTLAR